jgi:hypothetical protein
VTTMHPTLNICARQGGSLLLCLQYQHVCACRNLTCGEVYPPKNSTPISTLQSFRSLHTANQHSRFSRSPRRVTTEREKKDRENNRVFSSHYVCCQRVQCTLLNQLYMVCCWSPSGSVMVLEEVRRNEVLLDHNKCVPIDNIFCTVS